MDVAVGSAAAERGLSVLRPVNRVSGFGAFGGVAEQQWR